MTNDTFLNDYATYIIIGFAVAILAFWGWVRYKKDNK